MGLFRGDFPRITARVHAGGSYRGPDPGTPTADHLLKELALHSGTESDMACATRVPHSCQRVPLALSSRGAQCGGGETPRPVSKKRVQHWILRVWPQGLGFSAPRYTNKHPQDLWLPDAI